MRVLLDHCLDWRLSRSLPGHVVKAAGKLGWGHLKDAPLLSKAQTRFDVLVTSDNWQLMRGPLFEWMRAA